MNIALSTYILKVFLASVKRMLVLSFFKSIFDVDLDKLVILNAQMELSGLLD